jgi:hypothetical protein
MNEILRNPGTAQIANTVINQALLRHGLPLTSPLKAAMEASIDIIGAHHDAEFRVVDDRGRSLTLDNYLNEAKLNPKYAADFPKTGPPQISVADEAGINANVMRIARGELVVTDDRE